MSLMVAVKIEFLNVVKVLKFFNLNSACKVIRENYCLQLRSGPEKMMKIKKLSILVDRYLMTLRVIDFVVQLNKFIPTTINIYIYPNDASSSTGAGLFVFDRENHELCAGGASSIME